MWCSRRKNILIWIICREYDVRPFGFLSEMLILHCLICFIRIFTLKLFESQVFYRYTLLSEFRLLIYYYKQKWSISPKGISEDRCEGADVRQEQKSRLLILPHSLNDIVAWILLEICQQQSPQTSIASCARRWMGRVGGKMSVVCGWQDSVFSWTRCQEQKRKKWKLNVNEKPNNKANSVPSPIVPCEVKLLLLLMLLRSLAGGWCGSCFWHLIFPHLQFLSKTILSIAQQHVHSRQRCGGGRGTAANLTFPCEW